MISLAIYLTKRLRIAAPPAVGASNAPLVATFNRNLNGIGFTMAPDLIAALAAADQAEVVRVCAEALPILKKMVGDHRAHRPMYPNFPKQVMEAGDAELYLNAMMHYWGSFLQDTIGVPMRFLPEYEKAEREPLPDAEVKLRVIRLGDRRDFDSIFTALVGSNGSLSPADKEIVAWFMKERRVDLDSILPASIPQKETLALLVGDQTVKKPEVPHYLLKYLKTATDALRVAVVMSAGDVSLAKPTKFRRFCRGERRFLLRAIESAPSATEDMLRRPEVFKCLGHALHVGEYAKRYPKAAAAFGVVRNNEAFETFNSKVEKGLKTKDVGVADLLSARPGDFSRRLDHVLRVAGDGGSEAILRQYEAVVDGVSTPALVQAHAHFKHRGELGFRAFFPKGDAAKVQVVGEALSPLGAGVSEKVVEIIHKALVRRFAKLPSLGRTFVDPELKTQMVPFALRSASRALRTVARGSWIALPECSTLRFFVWWKDGESRTDIDLSAAFLGEDFAFLTAATYYNLRGAGFHHSGDITSAPKGAAEFIDVDIDIARKQGRYVVMVLNSFTQQPFNTLPECFAGWMARTEVNSGEVFEARTVQDKIDITADRTAAVPVLFDLEKRAAIWVDLALKSTDAINNVRSNTKGISLMAKALATLPKPTLYDLFSFHVEARGQMATREDAETVFSLREGVTPFDQDRILSEFLG